MVTLGIIGWLVALFWLVGLVPSMWSLLIRNLRRIASTLPVPVNWPRVSIIVPARNEGPNIEQTLQDLLAINYADLELIVINDRSEDETGEIIDRIAESDSRLNVIHIETLPDDWLGKNHAMMQGAKRATGEFLLFTDGDIRFDPGSIYRAMQFVLHNEIDHLALFPKMIGGSFAENGLQTWFGVLFCLGFQPGLVRSRSTLFYVGVGAFNLVKREIYEQAGGHEPLKLDVLDDVKLGKLLKRNGARQDVLSGRDEIAVKWQDNAWGIIKGLEKNAFASQDYSLVKLCLTTILFFTLIIAPYVAVAWQPGWETAGFAAALLLMHAGYGLLGGIFGGGWWLSFALPFSANGVLFAFWRSAWITLHEGGVRWRNTIYPLSQLKQNLYR